MKAPLSRNRLVSASTALQGHARTEPLGDILQLLVQGCLVERLANSELAVHTLLRDVEALHVEEAIFAHGLDERLRELLSAFWGVVQAQVDCDEVRPVEVFLEGARSSQETNIATSMKQCLPSSQGRSCKIQARERGLACWIVDCGH